MLENLNTKVLQFNPLTPEEKEKRGILGRLFGPIASFRVGTRNGRKYSDELWEKVFQNNIVKELLANGGIPGELDHPADREETCSEKIAVMMPEAPKKDADGHLMGYFDIIDTPNGRIAAALAKYGFNFGVSSRGSGDVIQDYDGQESVDPDTYTLNAWDLVLIPACEDARMQFVESYQPNNRMALAESLHKLVENATPDDKKIMEDTIRNLKLTEAKSEDDAPSKKGRYVIRDKQSGDIMTQVDGVWTRLLEDDNNSGYGSEEEAKSALSKLGSQFGGGDDMFYVDSADGEEEIPSEEGVGTIPDEMVPEDDGTIMGEEQLSDDDLDMLKQFGADQEGEIPTDEEVMEDGGIMDDSAMEDELPEEPMPEPPPSSTYKVTYKFPQNDNEFFFISNDCEDKDDAESRAKTELGDDIEIVGTKQIDEIHVEESYSQTVKPKFKNGKAILDVNTTKDGDKHIEVNESVKATTNDGADMINVLQETLKEKKQLERDLLALQEKLSVCYAEEARKDEQIVQLKKSIRKMSADAQNSSVLKDRVSQLTERLQEAEKSLQDKQIMVESLNDKSRVMQGQKQTLKDDSTSKTVQIRQLTEKYKSLEETKNKEVSALNESLEDLKKDLEQTKSTYTQKLDKANKLVEKYKKIANTAADKYISSQAHRLGVSVNEIKNKLAESYSFDDIDAACESLQAYKINMNRLPFRTSSGLNENIKMGVNTPSKEQPSLENRPDFDDSDFVDEQLLALAGLN